MSTYDLRFAAVVGDSPLLPAHALRQLLLLLPLQLSQLSR